MSNIDVNLLEEKLARCRDIPLDEISIDDVDEITDIKIDKRKPSNERILDFLCKTKNPYAFKIKGKIVKISFSETERTADDCLTSVLKNLYR